MKQTYFEQTLKKIASGKEAAIQKLVDKTFDELREIRKDYFRLYQDAEASGFEEASQVHYLKYRIIDEAIEVKLGNEEQAWDYLT